MRASKRFVAPKVRKPPYGVPVHYLYVRCYDTLVRLHQGISPFDTEDVVMTSNVVKFGITRDLQQREQQYGEDHGLFRYVLAIPTKSVAQQVENELRRVFKCIKLHGTHEYIKMHLLRAHFRMASASDDAVILRLFEDIIRRAHALCPQMASLPESCGVEHTSEKLETATGDPFEADYRIVRRVRSHHHFGQRDKTENVTCRVSGALPEVEAANH